MKKRLMKQIIALFLCAGLALGMFDGVPFVGEYVSTVKEAEAASGYDEKVNAFINDARWRNGTVWGNKKSILSPQLGGIQCCAYASDFVNYVFGKTSQKSGTYFDNVAEIRAGDTVFVGNFHWLVVLYRDGNYLYTAEGNYVGRVRVKKYGYRIEGNRIINTEDSRYNYAFTKGYHYSVVSVPAPVIYSLSTGNATNISNQDARISGSMSPAGNVSSWGFFIGTDAGAMQKYTVGGVTYSGNMACDVGRYHTLNYGTVYYYKTWAVVNGQEKHGEVKSFRTTAVKPDIPTLKINKADQDIGLESSVTVNWSGMANADFYKLYLYDEEDELIETSGQVTGTKYVFQAAEKTGKYHAKIEAYNAVGTKGSSNTVEFTVHPDVTVTFMDADSFVDVGEDWEPEELGSQTIHYGKSAAAPANPEHTGYTFKKWSGEFSNVKEDMTVKAVYDINQYTVRYVDSVTQEVLGTEKVDYYSSANPVDFKVPTGYVKTGYDGWDKDYKCITENTTLNTCIGWYNENFPVYAELVSAVREYDAEESDNEGYTIEAKVTNWDKSTTKGRIVVALKTKEGKLLTSTESSAFSVKKNAVKTVEIFVPYDKAASIAEIYVIGQYKDAVPITTTVSNNATLEIDQSSVYTNWSTEQPPEEAAEKEERTEYRYRDKNTTTSYETSLSGYTCDGSSWVQTGSGIMDYIPSFPYGFDTGSWLYSTYHRNPVTPSETATDKTTVSTSTVGWLYYHWCRNGNYSGNLKNRTVNGTYTSKWWNFHAFVTGVALGWDARGAFYGDLPGQCNDTYWWIGNGEGNAANVPVLRCSYTNYRKLFTYSKWSDFSDWSTTKQESTSTRDVENRTVYRYLTDEMMKEDNSGEERVIEGSMGAGFAGKEATLFIYKVDEASDYTNEYVAQTKLDDEGNYKFECKLREEPSVSTGDLTVVLGVEGNSTAIYLDTIAAPKKKHKVRFFDYKGEVISEQKVVDGGAAELPSVEKTKRTGYTFTKWSDTNINITEDKDIYAEYSLNKYQVVFVDWKANSVRAEEFEYGSRLTTPVAEEPDEGEVVEWDLVADGVDTVTDNLVVCTRYKTRTFDVKILGFDGKVVDEQAVEYGKAVKLPQLDAEANACTFYGWKNIAGGAEEEFTDLIIREETLLAPDFSYNETVEMPTADVPDGEYDSPRTVTLSTGTAGADIYYTLDGSDPTGAAGIRYTAPILVEDATVLRYYARAEKKNESEVNENYYVVNYEGARSAWMPYKELPQKVKDNQSEYDIYADTGYAYKQTKEITLAKEAEQLSESGWDADGESWSEYSEWQDTPVVEDGTYIAAEVETRPVYSTTAKYQYSHYVYTDGSATCYSATEVEGADCTYETIELDKSLTIAGFTDEGTTFFVQDGVEWFNQKKITGKTQTGLQYRSRHKLVLYAKWSDYTIDIPSENEKREYKELEVFSYVRHNSYIVNIYAMANKLQTQIVEEGSTIQISDLEETEGYSYDGIYMDQEFTEEWNPRKDKVNENLTLYVKAVPNTYHVSFKNEKGREINSQEVAFLEEAQVPVLKEEDGKRFVGWSTQEYQCVTRDLEVTANCVPADEYATIRFDVEQLSLRIGGSGPIQAEIMPVSQSETLIYWESSDNAVAIVSDQGVVSGIGEGEAVITAVLESTGERAECTVRVAKNGSAEITPTPNAIESTPVPSSVPSSTPVWMPTLAPDSTQVPPTSSAIPTQTPVPVPDSTQNPSSLPSAVPTHAPEATPVPTPTPVSEPKDTLMPNTPVPNPTQTPPSLPSAVPTGAPKDTPAPGTTPQLLLTPNVLVPVTTEPKAVSPAKVGQVKKVQAKKGKKKSIRITWKKTAGASGYQIQYALNEKFSKNKKSKSVKSTQTVLKKLKRKTYFIRVRAYKIDGTKMVYGKWSTTKKCSVK